MFCEDVEQVVDVEADVERIALVVDLELLLGFLLLAVRADDFQLPLSEHETHAAKFSFDRIAARCSEASRSPRASSTRLAWPVGITRL
jgi:hypothetical protein